jgi:hypothetical protein
VLRGGNGAQVGAINGGVTLRTPDFNRERDPDDLAGSSEVQAPPSNEPGPANQLAVAQKNLGAVAHQTEPIRRMSSEARQRPW